MLTHITLALAPSAQQQADLTSLLAAQQNPASADYHHWLTPEQYAARFGASDADLGQITVLVAGARSHGYRRRSRP